jgi:uncharacterized protein YjbJ (UPF0337 family)
MNTEELEGKWNQIKGEAKQRWGRCTDDEIDVIDGDHDKLVGKIQERYGKSKDEAKREVDSWKI